MNRNEPALPPAAGRPCIVAITPARNEGEYLAGTIESMVAQTVRPTHWILVDDGSTDATADIAAAAARAHAWITVLRLPDGGKRVLGGGVVRAFLAGLAATPCAWDYVCKVDADLRFAPRYLEHLLGHFAADPRLGSASGKFHLESEHGCEEERICDDSVAGCFKTYSRACYEAIGGLHPAVMWDGIDFHRARQEGFRTRSFHDPELRIVHRRRMGSSDRGVLRGRLRHGRGQHYIGSHPLYMLASAASRLAEWPYVVGAATMVAGYVDAAVRRAPRYQHPGFREELRRWQLQRLAKALRGGGVR